MVLAYLPTFNLGDELLGPMLVFIVQHHGSYKPYKYYINFISSINHSEMAVTNLANKQHHIGRRRVEQNDRCAHPPEEVVLGRSLKRERLDRHVRDVGFSKVVPQ